LDIEGEVTEIYIEYDLKEKEVIWLKEIVKASDESNEIEALLKDPLEYIDHLMSTKYSKRPE